MDTRMIKKEVILPKVNRGNGTSKSKWFLYYSIKNPATGQMVRFRIYDGFNELKTVEAKEKHSEQLLKKWHIKLLKGFNPFFEQDKIEYACRIKYDLDAVKTGRMVEAKKDINYYISVYLDYIREDKKLRPSTFTTYKSKLRIFSQWLNLKGMDNCQIRFYNLNTIKLFNTYLKDKRALSGKSMNQYNVTIHGFFEYLIKEKKGVCVINPVEGMQSYPENSAHHRAYSEGYIDKIKERLSGSDPWLWLMIKVLFSTLLRPKELRFVQFKYIDWVDGILYLPGFISKNGRDRTITIPSHLLKDLRAAGYDKIDSEFYFFGGKKKPAVKPASKNHLYNCMKSILMELNVPKGFTLYSWKHTGVQQLAKKEVPYMFIKAQLGHASYDQMIPYIEELLTQGNDRIRYDSPSL
jgi:integrase